MDIKVTARNNDQMDRAIEAAADYADNLCQRQFYPEDKTSYYDWPSFQLAYPWRIWLDAGELADVTVTVPVVSSGGVVIPANRIFWYPWNYAPPFTAIELDRSTSAAFGSGTTPQRNVAITGTHGYWLNTVSAGVLAAAVTDTTGTTITVSNAAGAGVGDLIIIGSERMLVQAQLMTDTTIAFSGLSAASNTDRVVAVADGTQFTIGEVLQFDTERCLLADINGNNLYLQRAWDGTILAGHTSGTIYAARKWTVARGQLGTVAATHGNAAPVTRSVTPALVHQLAVAEAANNVLQETSGYSRTIGEGDTLRPMSGAGLADIRARTLATYGRKARQRVI